METMKTNPDVQKSFAWKNSPVKLDNKGPDSSKDDLSASMYDVVKNRTSKADSSISNIDVLTWCESPRAQLYMENIVRQNIKSERHTQLCNTFSSGTLEEYLLKKSPFVNPAIFLGSNKDIARKIWEIAARVFDNICPSPQSNVSQVDAQLKYFRAKYVDVVMVPEVMVKYFEVKNDWNSKKAWEFYHHCNSSAETEKIKNSSVLDATRSANVGIGRELVTDKRASLNHITKGIAEIGKGLHGNESEKTTIKTLQPMNISNRSVGQVRSVGLTVEEAKKAISNNVMKQDSNGKLPSNCIKKTMSMASIKTNKDGKIHKFNSQENISLKQNGAESGSVNRISDELLRKIEMIKERARRNEVSRILDSRLTEGNRKQYLVKFKDETLVPTWKKEEDLNCLDQIKLFENLKATAVISSSNSITNTKKLIPTEPKKLSNIDLLLQKIKNQKLKDVETKMAAQQKKVETLRIKDFSQLKSATTKESTQHKDPAQKNAKDILIKKEQLVSMFKSSNILDWFSSPELKARLNGIIKEEVNSERHKIVISAFQSKKFDESYEAQISKHLRMDFLEMANRQSTGYRKDLASQVNQKVDKIFEEIFPSKPSEKNDYLAKKFREHYIKYVLIPEGVVGYLQNAYDWSITIAEQFYRKFKF